MKDAPLRHGGFTDDARAGGVEAFLLLGFTRALEEGLIDVAAGVPHVVKPRRSGDPTYLVADPAAARDALKFRPAHSDLATIIRTAWAWHKKAHPLKTDKPLSPAT